MSRVRRIDILTTWKQAGGTFLGHLRNFRNVNRGYSAEDGRTCTLEIPKVGSDRNLVRGQRVARMYVQGSSTPESWRIKKVSDPKGLGASHFMVELAGPEDALTDATIIHEVSAAGLVHFDTGLIQATLTEFVDDLILPSLSAAGQTYWERGTVDPTVLFDFDVNWSTPAAAVAGLLAKVKEAGIPCEFQVTETATKLRLNFVSAIGSAVTDIYASIGRQLNSGERVVDHTQQMTRAFVRGAEDGNGVPATLAEMVLEIVATDGTASWLQVRDPDLTAPPAIAFDDQFNSLYAVKDNPTFSSVQITDTVASTQRIFMSSISGFSVGELIELRRTSGSDGEEISSLLAAPHAVEWDDIARTVVVPAMMHWRNRVKYGDFPTWLAGDSSDPTGWTSFLQLSLGAPTYQIAKETDLQYVLHGTFSARLKQTSGGTSGGKMGLYAPFHVHRRTGKSVFAVRAKVFLDTGAAANTGECAITLDLQTSSGSSISGGQVASQSTPQFLTDNLYTVAINGFDANVAARNDYRLRVSLDGFFTSDFTIRIAEVLVFMGTFSDEELLELPFTRHSHANRGIHPANRALEIFAPPLVDYSVEMRDLEFLDPVRFSAEKLQLGAHLRIRDSEIGGAPIRTRMVGLETGDSASTRVQLSSRKQFFSEIV